MFSSLCVFVADPVMTCNRRPINLTKETASRNWDFGFNALITALSETVVKPDAASCAPAATETDETSAAASLAATSAERATLGAGFGSRILKFEVIDCNQGLFKARKMPKSTSQHRIKLDVGMECV